MSVHQLRCEWASGSPRPQVPWLPISPKLFEQPLLTRY